MPYISRSTKNVSIVAIVRPQTPLKMIFFSLHLFSPKFISQMFVIVCVCFLLQWIGLYFLRIHFYLANFCPKQGIEICTVVGVHNYCFCSVNHYHREFFYLVVIGVVMRLQFHPIPFFAVPNVSKKDWTKYFLKKTLFRLFYWNLQQAQFFYHLIRFFFLHLMQAFVAYNFQWKCNAFCVHVVCIPCSHWCSSKRVTQ